MIVTKRSRFHTGKAFSVEICDHIRHHFGLAEVAEKNRKQAFDDRDAAVSELEECQDQESPEAVKLKAMHSDATLKIERLSKTHKWHLSQAVEAARKGDEPEFNFMYDPPDSLFQHKKGEEGQMKIGESERTPQEADPGVPEGEAQHLAASINELEIGKDEKDQCIAAGCTTVGALKRLMDEDPTWGDLAKKLGLTGQAKPLNEIGRAVKAYCKTHEKAALAKFKGEPNGPRVDHRKPLADRIGKGATKTKGKKIARK